MKTPRKGRQRPKKEKKVSEEPQSELVVGLIGPTGVDLDRVTSLISETLSRFNYTTNCIRISGLLRKEAGLEKSQSMLDGYTELMDAGDEYRRKHENDGLSKRAILEIRRWRQENSADDGPVIPSRVVHIIRSLKTPEELQLFKSVYGDAFVGISIGENEAARVDRLAKQLRAEQRRKIHIDDQTRIKKLLVRDERDSTIKHGQNVRGTFPLADLFVDMNRGVDKARREIERFFRLVFGFQFISPTKDEWAMFVANASALRSLELGRQVGASVVNDAGQIIATGCNELPRAGGGLVWTEDLAGADDPRDWKKGVDTNRMHSVENIVEVLEKLREAGWLNSSVPADVESMVSEAEKILLDTRSLSLTEYGRAVHAEMAALVDAASRGVSVQGAHLFTTTFPCHNCARHIIASGVKRMVFIEPYPKSLAAAFHHEAIAIGEMDLKARDERVLFEAFSGISPRAYSRVFEAGQRKDSHGRVTQWQPQNSRPRQSFAAPHISYMDRETLIQEELNHE